LSLAVFGVNGRTRPSVLSVASGKMRMYGCGYRTS